VTRARSVRTGKEDTAGKPNRTTLYVATIVAALAAGASATALLRPKPSHAISAHVQRALQNHRNFQGHSGPWGLIEYSRIAVSMPLEADAMVVPGRHA
jgi:hypothetical protein